MPEQTPGRLPPAASILVGIGVSGLLVSGFGRMPGTPAWVWLVVLLAGAFLPHLRERSSDARTRTDDLRHARDASDNARYVLQHQVSAWEKRLEGVITPEESRRLRADFNAMLLDFAKLRGEVEEVAKEQRVREMGDSIFPEVS